MKASSQLAGGAAPTLAKATGPVSSTRHPRGVEAAPGVAHEALQKTLDGGLLDQGGRVLEGVETRISIEFGRRATASTSTPSTWPNLGG